jgi:hypothetical protein
VVYKSILGRPSAGDGLDLLRASDSSPKFHCTSTLGLVFQARLSGQASLAIGSHFLLLVASIKQQRAYQQLVRTYILPHSHVTDLPIRLDQAVNQGRPHISTMTARKSSPGGILDSYLQEKHAVLEKEVCKASQQNKGGVAGHASTTDHNGKKAAAKNHHQKGVEDLDKYMAAVTDREILEQGREDQKRECLFASLVSRR